jgi:hypothetical protein
MRVMTRSIRTLLAVGVGLMLLSCQSTAKKSDGPTILISEQELRTKVDAMSSNFISKIEISVMRISGQTRDNMVRRQVLYLKTKTISAIETATDHPKALTAFFDLWALAFQMDLFLMEKEKELEKGKASTSEIATKVNATDLAKDYREVRLEFQKVAKTILPPESYEQTLKSVEQYVKDYSITGSGGTITRISFSDTAVGGVLSPVLSLPMAPFRAMEGVGKGGDAAGDIVPVAKQFTRVIQRMPQHLGWEMESLALDYRREIDEIIDNLDEKQGSLQGTLHEVQTSLATVDSIAARTEVITASVDNTVTTLDATSSSIESLLNTYKDTMMTLYPPKTPEEKAAEAAREANSPAEEKKPFDINEYTAALAELTAASGELQGVLVELRSTIDGDSLDRVVEGAGKVTTAALTETTQSLDGVIDNITRRIILILLIAFGLAVVFLILSRWVIRRKAA